MSVEDAVANLSWPEYTEEDLQRIDRLCEESRPEDSKTDNGAPSIFIELEGTADGSDKSVDAPQVVDKSPFALFRERRGYLSVTDIVAPAWCEVQFDYGLQQFRNKPLSKRPKTFVTKKGKEIHVKTEVAAKNDRILEKGKAVHKKLEREIHKEEVPIKVKSKEESWALRLLDFLSRLKSSSDTFVCREVPVWGIIHDHAVYGVIDELHLESSGETCRTNSSASQEVRAQDSQTQAKLDSFIINARKIIHASSPNPKFNLLIIDNKTRKSPSMPSHVDTLPSRLQLMLYWLMLTQALAVSSDGPSFSAFCSRTGADPARVFSKAFIAEMSALVIENELSLHFLDAKCLEDMDFPYKESIKDMGLDAEGCVSKRLSLVYRLRGKSVKRSKASTATAPTNELANPENKLCSPTVVKEIPENPDVTVDGGDAKVVPPMDGSVDAAESTRHEGLSTFKAVESVEEVTPGATTATDNTNMTPPADTLRKRKRHKPCVSSTSTAKSTAEIESDSSSDESDGDASSANVPDTVPTSPSAFILGMKKFQYNAELLDAHLSSVLAWWHGKRLPVGVSIEDTGRCNSCEYKAGCEWREQKALELLEKTSTKAVSDPNDRIYYSDCF